MHLACLVMHSRISLGQESASGSSGRIGFFCMCNACFRPTPGVRGDECVSRVGTDALPLAPASPMERHPPSL